MKKLLAAIARSIAAMARTVTTTTWTFCKETGKWIGTTVANIGAIGGSAAPAVDTSLQDLEAEMSAAATNPAAPAVDTLKKRADEVLAMNLTPPKSGGDGYDRIQRACRNINRMEQPAREDWEALSPVQQEWLRELTPPMRLVVGNCDRESLIAHIRGKKTLKGVLPCVSEAIAAWKHANEIEAAIAEMDAAGQTGELEPAAPRIAV